MENKALNLIDVCGELRVLISNCKSANGAKKDKANLPCFFSVKLHGNICITLWLMYRSFLTAKKKKQTRQVIVWEKWVVGVKYSGSKELYIT